jgi:hypothetical protein
VVLKDADLFFFQKKKKRLFDCEKKKVTTKPRAFKKMQSDFFFDRSHDDATLEDPFGNPDLHFFFSRERWKSKTTQQQSFASMLFFFLFRFRIDMGKKMISLIFA